MTEEQARREVAARLRRLADRLATDDAPDATWAQVAAGLAEVDALLPTTSPAETRFARGHRDSGDLLADPSAAHPLATATSGVYPPLRIEAIPTGLRAEVRFGTAWEGPPGLVHGGFLAAGFDIVLSALAHQVLGPSVTRSLRVRYLKPTFLTADLRFEVEPAGEPEGRLLDLRATLFANDRVTMRATAQFASLDPARFADRRPSPAPTTEPSTPEP